MLKSRVHGYFVLVFIRKLLVSIAFAGLTTSESETTSNIIPTSPSNLLWKMWIWVFLNIMPYYYFSLEAVSQRHGYK